MRGKLYRYCVHSCMLHDSETWPWQKENNFTFQRAEMRMIRWMNGLKVTNRFTCRKMTDKLRVDTIIAVVQRYRLIAILTSG